MSWLVELAAEIAAGALQGAVGRAKPARLVRGVSMPADVAPAPPVNAALRAQPPPSRRLPVEPVAPIAPVDAVPAPSPLIAALRSPQGLLGAVVAAEILGAPLALRDPETTRRENGAF